MPTYIVGIDGKDYQIEGSRPPTEVEARAALKPWLDGNVAEAPDPSLWDIVKNTSGNVLKGGLEFIGRPGEGVSGFVGGLADKGVGEGLRRAGAAMFEPNLAESKIQENFSKVMEEQGILKDNPWIRAGVGFAADAITDPMNLAMGAGFLRKGITTGLTKAGLSRTAAEALTLQPVGKAVQRGFASTGRLTKEALVKAGIGSNKMALSTLMGKSGVTAKDVEYLARLEEAAKNADDLAAVNKIYTKGSLTDLDNALMPDALASPLSVKAGQVAQQAAAGDTRVSTALDEITALLTNKQQAEMAAGVMPARKVMTDVTEDMARTVDALSPTQRQNLKDAFNQPGVVDPKTKVIDINGLAKLQTFLQADPGLQRLSHEMVAKFQIQDGLEVFPRVDFTTLGFDKGRFVPTGSAGYNSALPTFSNVSPNYVPHVGVIPSAGTSQKLGQGLELNASLGSAKQQELTWNQAKAAGALPTMHEILRRRLTSSNRAVTDYNILARFGDDFGSRVAAPGLREVAPGTMNYLPENIRTKYQGTVNAQGVYVPSPLYVPNAVADRIEKVVDRISDPNKMTGFWTQASKLFKVIATTYNVPGHQMGNAIGNTTAFYAATDATMPEVLKGVAKATRVVKGKATFETISVNGFGAMDSAEVVAQAKRYGVGGTATGFAGETTAPERLTTAARDWFGQETGIRSILNPDNKVAQSIRDFNQRVVEDPAKLAMFYHELKSGKTVEQAVLSVQATLFDYNDISHFEKTYIRPIIPFYTWTRKNIPLQMANMATRSAKVSNQRRLLDMAWEMSKSDDVEDIPKNDLPSYVRGPDSFPIVGVSGAEGKPVFGKARLPIMDLGLLSTDEFAKRAGFQLTPPLRMAIELLMNKRIGDEDYRTILSQRDEPAGFLGRTLGPLVGATEDPELGTRQEAFSKWAMESLPIPGGAALRTMDSMSREGSDLNPFIELLLRSLSVAPTQTTDKSLKQEEAAKTRRLLAGY